MNKKNKKKLLLYLSIIVFITLISIVIFKDNLFNGKAFSWYNDQEFQYNIFYQEYHAIIQETINNKIPSFYSWNLFLGTDFFSSKLFTVVGDVFAIIAFILFEEINYDLFFTIETIICLVLSAVLFTWLLDKFGIKKNSVKFAIATSYAFSGFIILFTGTYMFHRFYAFFPLLLIAAEYHIQNRKIWPISLVVVLLLLQNYELMFSASLFLVIYYIFSYKRKNIDSKTIDIIKNALPLVGGYLIGILLSGIFLIPLVLFLKNNSRVGAMEFGSLLWTFKENFHLMISSLYPPINFRTDSPSYMFYTDRYTSMTSSIYVGAIFVVSLIYLFKTNNKQYKKLYLITELVILVFILIRPLNMVMHAFSEPTFRFCFLLSSFHLILTADVLDNFDYNINIKKELTIVSIVLAILLFVYLFVYNLSVVRYLINIVLVIISILLIFIFDYANKKNLMISMLLVVLNITCVYQYSIYSMMKDVDKNPVAFNAEYLDYYQNIDESKMFRYYFDPTEIKPFNKLNLNAGLKYGYPTTTSYDSAYETILNDFLNMNGMEGWIIDINRLDLLQMLGVKYIGTIDDSKYINNSNLHYAYNLDDILIYEINDYNSIGHTYNNYIKRKDVVENNINWNNTLIIKDEDYSLVEDLPSHNNKYQLEIIEYNRQYLKVNIEHEGQTVLLISIPYSDGWKIKDQNENDLTTLNVQGGFLGVLINEDSSEINMYFLSPGLKTGFIVSALGSILLVILVIIEWKCKRSKKHEKNIICN